ncbi:cold-shock protein [Candidatus Magnetomonas plexicatena]
MSQTGKVKWFNEAKGYGLSRKKMEATYCSLFINSREWV